MYVLWKITSGNFYIAKSEKKYIQCPRACHLCPGPIICYNRHATYAQDRLFAIIGMPLMPRTNNYARLPSLPLPDKWYHFGKSANVFRSVNSQQQLICKDKKTVYEATRRLFISSKLFFFKVNVATFRHTPFDVTFKN